MSSLGRGWCRTARACPLNHPRECDQSVTQMFVQLHTLRKSHQVKFIHTTNLIKGAVCKRWWRVAARLQIRIESVHRVGKTFAAMWRPPWTGPTAWSLTERLSVACLDLDWIQITANPWPGSEGNWEIRRWLFLQCLYHPHTHTHTLSRS